MLKKKNPIAVKKVIGNRKGFSENFIFQCLRHFSRSIFFLNLLSLPVSFVLYVGVNCRNGLMACNSGLK